MKTLKTMALAFAFFASGLAFAGASPVEKDKPESIGQIVADLFSNPEIVLTHNQDVLVEFYIDEKNEIVVLSVDSDDYFINRFIRFRLNNEKVSSDFLESKTH